MGAKIWTKLINFILDKDNQRFILFVALVGAIMFGFNQCDRKQAFKQEVQKQKNNIIALNDSVGYYKNEAGELTAEKLALQSDKKQLKDLNEELYEELEKEKDKVEQLTQVNAELRSDSMQTDTTTVTQNDERDWRLDWNLSRGGDKWARILTGYTEFTVDTEGVPFNPNTVITKDLIKLQFTTGITEDDGQRKIFVRSSYPDLQVTDIDGAIIRESAPVSNPSRFGIGFQLGGGYTPKGFHPYAGFGINYNLINL